MVTVLAELSIRKRKPRTHTNSCSWSTEGTKQTEEDRRRKWSVTTVIHSRFISPFSCTDSKRKKRELSFIQNCAILEIIFPFAVPSCDCWCQPKRASFKNSWAKAQRNSGFNSYVILLPPSFPAGEASKRNPPERKQLQIQEQEGRPPIGREGGDILLLSG